MNIVVFSAFYPPIKGGYIESLHGLLVRLGKRGHCITVLTCDESIHRVSEEIVEDLHVLRVPVWNPKSLNKSFPIPKPWHVIRALQILWKRKIDLISTQTRFYPISWLGFVIAKWWRIPICHTERGGVHTETDSFVVRWGGKILDHTFGFLLCRYATATVGVSDATCRFLRHLGAKEPLTIYNGINVDYWASDKVIKTPDNIITFVGRIVYAKGIQDLFKAVQASGVASKIYLIGDGEYREPLQKLSKELGIEDRVIFWGEKNHAFIRSILRATDIFINPSYSEGLPRSVLEAGAAGCAVIATDVGGTDEIIPSSQYGIRVKPHDVASMSCAIRQLFDNHLLKQRLSQNLQLHIRERFTWESVVNKYEKLFIYLTREITIR